MFMRKDLTSIKKISFPLADDNKYHFRRHFLISSEMHLKYKIFLKTFHG